MSRWVAEPAHAPPDPFRQVDLGRESELAARSGDVEPVLAAEELKAVSHERRRLCPVSKSPRRLRGRAEHDSKSVWDMAPRSGGPELGSDGLEVVELGHRLVIDEEVCPANRVRRLAGEENAPGHVLHVDHRQVVPARADHDHAAFLNHRGEPGKACTISGTVDPTWADDDNGRSPLSDGSLDQQFARDLAPRVRIRLLTKRRPLVGDAAYVVAVDCDRADMDEALHTGCKGGIEQHLQAHDVRPLVIAGGTPRSRLGGAMKHRVDAGDRPGHSRAVRDIAPHHLHGRVGKSIQVLFRSNQSADASSPAQEQLDQVAAEEAGRAGDQDSHARLPATRVSRRGCRLVSTWWAAAWQGPHNATKLLTL